MTDIDVQVVLADLGRTIASQAIDLAVLRAQVAALEKAKAEEE